MIRIYDTECVKCGYEEEQFKDDDKSFSRCPLCGKEMKKVFNKMTFKLLYNPKKDICAWSNENYATSQYWRYVKEEREKGKKVKGFYED